MIPQPGCPYEWHPVGNDERGALQQLPCGPILAGMSADVDVRSGNPAAAACLGFVNDGLDDLGLGKQIELEFSQSRAFDGAWWTDRFVRI